MTDHSELKRLAEAAGRMESWFTPEILPDMVYQSDREFVAAASPAAVLGLLAENERLQQFKTAYTEWSDKTDWVQKSAEACDLGKHRADVLKGRIDRLNKALGDLLALYEGDEGCRKLPQYIAGRAALSKEAGRG